MSLFLIKKSFENVLRIFPTGSNFFILPREGHCFWKLCIASGNFNLLRTWKGLGLTQGRMTPQKVSYSFECLETLQRAHQLAESWGNIKATQKYWARAILHPSQRCLWQMMCVVASLPVRVRCHGLQLPQRVKLRSEGAEQTWGEKHHSQPCAH